MNTQWIFKILNKIYNKVYFYFIGFLSNIHLTAEKKSLFSTLRHTFDTLQPITAYTLIDKVKISKNSFTRTTNNIWKKQNMFLLLLLLSSYFNILFCRDCKKNWNQNWHSKFLIFRNFSCFWQFYWIFLKGFFYNILKNKKNSNSETACD